MYAQVEKSKENKSRTVVNSVSQKKNDTKQSVRFVDNRSGAVAQRKLQELAINNPRTMQLKAMQNTANNNTQAILNDSLPIQRAIDSTEKPALGLLIERYTANPGTYGSINDSATFNVFIMEADMDAAAGVTTASLMNEEGQVVLDITNGVALRGLTADQIKNTAQVEIGVTISSRRSNYATGAIQAQDQSGQIVTVLHEFERHVYPFFKLWNEMIGAQIAELLVEGEELSPEIVTLLSNTSATDGEYNAETQHQNPDLSTNTIVSIINAILVGEGNRTKLLFQACMDTIGRGVSLDTVSSKVSLAIRQNHIWIEFLRLALFVQGAERRLLKTAFSEENIGERVLVVEGAYMGMFGTISEDSFLVVGDEGRDPRPVELVILVDGDYVVMPPSYFMVEIA
jgi:hypothetical protein